MSSNSFQNLAIPAAIISDGVIPVPLFAVTQMVLTETYHLPPIGSAGARAIVSTHDDTISLQALLVGPTRYALKALIETMAETSKRGTKLAVVGPKMAGLILITAMTIRTDMQITELTFTASNAKRQVLEVSMRLAYVPPPPGLLGKLLDLASVAVGALADAGGN